jgi:hypothetical protein
MRTYWLSFCDGSRAEGAQFLGVVVVDVTEAEAAAALADIDRECPGHRDDGGWIAAAARKAHAQGCNPGGDVAAVRYPEAFAAGLAGLPRGQLLQVDALRALGVL